MQHKTWLLFIALVTATSEATAARELWVELVDSTGLPAEQLVALKREVSSIYDAAGAHIRWLDTSPEQTEPHMARVYLLDALPGTMRGRLRTFGGPPMAVALGRNGDVSGPVIYISRSASARLVRDPSRLGRALGRVVAHELAHRFVSRQHTRRGILRAGLHGGDLSEPNASFSFTETQREQLARVARTRRRSVAP